MSEELDDFIRRYNSRRRLSKLLLVLNFTTYLCLRFYGGGRGVDMQDPQPALLLSLILVSLAAYYFLCKCPSCGRFIGFRGAKRNTLPRGAPCELENEAFGRLDWPE